MTLPRDMVELLDTDEPFAAEWVPTDAAEECRLLRRALESSKRAYRRMAARWESERAKVRRQEQSTLSEEEMVAHVRVVLAAERLAASMAQGRNVRLKAHAAALAATSTVGEALDLERIRTAEDRLLSAVESAAAVRLVRRG